MSQPLLMVEWIDASRLNDGWVDWDAIPKAYLHKCVTVGFLVSDTKSAIILVPTIGDIEHENNRHTYGGMLIPKSAVVSTRSLK